MLDEVWICKRKKNLLNTLSLEVAKKEKELGAMDGRKKKEEGGRAREGRRKRKCVQETGVLKLLRCC